MSNVGWHKIVPPAGAVRHFPPLFRPLISVPPSLPLDILISLPLSSCTPVRHSLQHVAEIL